VGTSTYIVGEADGILLLENDDTRRALGVAVRQLEIEDWDVSEYLEDGAVLEHDAEDGRWRIVGPSEQIPDAVFDDAESWIVESPIPENRATFVAGMMGGSLAVARQLANGRWSVFDVFDGIPEADRIVEGLRVMRTPNGYVVLSGLNAAGELVTMRARQADLVRGLASFELENVVESSLAASGEAMPVFVGDPIAYTTPWDGQNYAGLDAHGDLWVVWTAPERSRWYANNLTGPFGHERLVGQIGVTVTDWGGIHIFAKGESGSLLVTWWTIGSGGTWRQSDLTEIAGGPSLVGDSLSTFSRGGNEFGVVGATKSGRVVLYQWASTSGAWRLVNLSNQADNDANNPVAFRAVVDLRGTLRVIGDTEDGRLVQLIPTVGPIDFWVSEDLGLAAM